MLWNKLLGANAAGGIKFVGSKTFTSNATVSSVSVSLTDLTGGISSSPSAGDFVLIYLGLATDGLSVAPTMSVTGYTPVGSVVFANGTYEANLLVAYKFMGVTPDTSANMNWSGSGVVSGEDARAGAIFVFRGVDQTTPVEDDGTRSSTSSTLIANFSAKPVGLDGGRACVAGGISAHRQGIQTYSSFDLDGFISAGVNDNNDCSVGAGYKLDLSASFTPTQFTFTGTSTGAFASRTVTLRPA